jgi:hypothetical protein
MFTSASYENRNRTNYYKVIYMFTSASYELMKTEIEQINIMSYTVFLLINALGALTFSKREALIREKISKLTS